MAKELNYLRPKHYKMILSKGRYSNIEIAAFITACGGDNLSIQESWDSLKRWLRDKAFLGIKKMVVDTVWEDFPETGQHPS
jgi:thymidine phosphorylase